MMILRLLWLVVLAELAAPAAAADDCDALYYGIGMPPDPVKAWHCFEAQHDFPMQIVMALNGEGAPATAAKVDDLFAAWETADKWNATKSLQAEALRKAAAAHKAGAGAVRTDFCDDVAGDTLNVNHCLGIKSRLAQAAHLADLANAKAGLSPADAAALDKVQTAFDAFKKAEGMRMYQQYIEGSIRNAVAINQEEFVRGHYAALLKTVLADRHAASGTDADYRAADDELNKTYTAHLKTYASYYERLLGDEKLKDQWPTFQQHIADYRAATKTAERDWLSYRDAWAKFYENLAHARPVAVLTSLTRDRIKELDNDPAGGN